MSVSSDQSKQVPGRPTACWELMDGMQIPAEPIWVFATRDGKKLALPCRHMVYCSLESNARLELLFSHHRVVIDGMLLERLFTLLLAGRSATLWEWDDTFGELPKNAPGIRRLSITERAAELTETEPAGGPPPLAPPKSLFP